MPDGAFVYACTSKCHEKEGRQLPPVASREVEGRPVSLDLDPRIGPETRPHNGDVPVMGTGKTNGGPRRDQHPQCVLTYLTHCQALRSSGSEQIRPFAARSSLRTTLAKRRPAANQFKPVSGGVSSQPLD